MTWPTGPCNIDHTIHKINEVWIFLLILLGGTTNDRRVRVILI
eukprot:CAMPEP_0183324832 /NCGR_PEP_ID=MMETSP0160_2-20130417/78101_1 /TAXON_ID=2839 ORGANISM="Odontella Sinensis, Strain Grunow 1884" /NCGR_SAMPLE_ID=MMETSP0160_2 /ASSEMBLY_ACC=CAM_ASM_000250 /LENGTH=42 /DNA_ID= /DNA_START= /DNA_END= /DNA_ORIENTATION=